MIQHSAYLILGFVMLYYGAEWLVRGSSQIALFLGISPLVVGLTVVAFGTSAPELFVCVQGNLSESPDFAIGPIVGSNICNLALILGVSALVSPLQIKAQIVKREMPILVIASLLFAWMFADKIFYRWEGLVLSLGILLYVFFSLFLARKEKDVQVLEEFEKGVGTKEKKTMGWLIFLIVSGLVVLIFGSALLVKGGQHLAKAFGVSEALISLTMIAVGTSLPELATSIIASLKKQGDIITGNAVGSSIFNLFAVVGITVLVKPILVKEVRWEDLFVMLGVTVVLVPFMWTRRRLSRVEGALLLAGYLGYCIYIFLRK